MLRSPYIIVFFLVVSSALGEEVDREAARQFVAPVLQLRDDIKTARFRINIFSSISNMGEITDPSAIDIDCHESGRCSLRTIEALCSGNKMCITEKTPMFTRKTLFGQGIFATQFIEPGTPAKLQLATIANREDTSEYQKAFFQDLIKIGLLPVMFSQQSNSSLLEIITADSNLRYKIDGNRLIVEMSNGRSLDIAKADESHIANCSLTKLNEKGDITSVYSAILEYPESDKSGSNFPRKIIHTHTRSGRLMFKEVVAVERAELNIELGDDAFGLLCLGFEEGQVVRDSRPHTETSNLRAWIDGKLSPLDALEGIERVPLPRPAIIPQGQAMEHSRFTFYMLLGNVLAIVSFLCWCIYRRFQQNKN